MFSKPTDKRNMIEPDAVRLKAAPLSWALALKLCADILTLAYSRRSLGLTVTLLYGFGYATWNHSKKGKQRR